MATVIERIKFGKIPETAEALQVTPQTSRVYIKQGNSSILYEVYIS